MEKLVAEGLLVLAVTGAMRLAGQDVGKQPADADGLRSHVEKLLERHPFFQRIDFDIDTRHAPFVFCVQRPAKQEANYLRRVVNAHGPYVTELLSVFEQEYAGPLGLERQPAHPCFPIAILNSRGMYGNYAQATGASSLHAARAHYDPETHVAVTYLDTFSTADAGATKDSERTALLHEVVHALQHAYARDGRMPRALWFVEGLAEYRSACGHLPEQLRQPPFRSYRLDLFAQVAGHPELRATIASLPELLRPTSYQQVLEISRTRAAAAGRPAPADALTLELFYAQASLFVRFLHEGQDRKHHAAALKIIDKLMTGLASDAALRHGFDGAPNVAELERQFRIWLTDSIRTHVDAEFPDLAPRVAAAGADAAPATFDPRAFAWRPADLDLRIEAVHQLCAAGEYDTALQILPTESECEPGEATARRQRELQRVEAVIALRDRAVADLVRTRAEIALTLDGSATKSKLVAREASDLRILVGTTERKAPVAALDPTALLQHCWRRSWLTTTDRWLERWLRWLSGTPIEKLRPLLNGSTEGFAELRTELRTTLVAKPDLRAVVSAIAAMQTLTLPDDRAAAWTRATELRTMFATHGRHPAVVTRRNAFAAALTALAERGLDVTNPACLGLTGQVQPLGGGRIRVTYADSKHDCFDMLPEHAYTERLGQAPTKLAYGGPTELRRTASGWEIVGSGFFRWALPLTKAHCIELDHTRQSDGPMLLVTCDDRDGNHLSFDPAGITVVDLPTRVVDHVGPRQWRFFPNRSHRIQIQHDGARLVKLTRDGEPVAEVSNPGSRSQGWLGLQVHTSTPITLTRLMIEGQIDTTAAATIRQRWIERTLAELPQPEPGPK